MRCQSDPIIVRRRTLVPKSEDKSLWQNNYTAQQKTTKALRGLLKRNVSFAEDIAHMNQVFNNTRVHATWTPPHVLVNTAFYLITFNEDQAVQEAVYGECSLVLNNSIDMHPLSDHDKQVAKECFVAVLTALKIFKGYRPIINDIVEQFKLRKQICPRNSSEAEQLKAIDVERNQRWGEFDQHHLPEYV